jgi:uncharacterized protein
MGPLIPQEIINPAWSNAIAVIIGIAFGFILESSGFSSSRKLAGVFYGYDFTVLRVFFTAAVTAAVGLFFFDYMGWMDIGMIYVNPYFINGSIGGGIIMGLGFITGGFCPGTSYCAAAIGKIDAMVFSVFMMVGILLFSLGYPILEGFYNANSRGPVLIYKVLGMNSALFLSIFVIMALAAFIVTARIQKKVRKVEY